MRTTKKTICPLDCPDTCGMVAAVEDGRVVSLNGDPDHPYTCGFICRKMRGYPDRLYSPHRVLYPQKRVGRKGAGHFKRISWDQAWDEMVSRMKQIIDTSGGSSILPFSYAGNMGMINRFAGFPLFHKMGAIQTEQTICSTTARAGWRLICGDRSGCPPQVAAESKLILAWGINIRVTNVHFWRYVKVARAAGAKLVVIDPYENDTARVADRYFQITPGGDSALALGVIKVIVENKWHDQPFITSQCEGAEQLLAYARQLPMTCVEKECGLDRDQINALALMLYENPQTFIRIGIGLSRNSRGGMAIRAIVSLAAACGLFDGQPGRGVLLSSGAFESDTSKLTFPDLAETPCQRVNMIHLGQVLSSHEPQVKSLIVYNANPLSVVPDGSRIREELCREDLFTIVHEQVMSPTARYADILLPATTFLENRDIYFSYGHFYCGLAEPVIEPLAETMSNFDFFQTFAQKMGYSDAAFQQTIDQRLQSYLPTITGAQGSVTLESFRHGRYLESIYNSPGISSREKRRQYIRFVNDENPTLPPHACMTGTKEFDNPDLSARFPFKLITPPNDKLLNSTFGERYCDLLGEVLIHPDDASQFEVKDGDEIVIVNLRGSTRRTARITNRTQPGLLVAEGIFWSEGDYGGINDLVTQQCADIGGGALFHETRVAIQHAGQE